jgi:hypothetical protein
MSHWWRVFHWAEGDVKQRLPWLQGLHSLLIVVKEGTADLLVEPVGL